MRSKFLESSPAMPANKKLTHLLAGRTIGSVAPGKNSKGEDVTILTLDDGSTLSIIPAPGSPVAVPTGGKLLKVRQDGASLNLDLAGGGTIALTVADPGNALQLRDPAGKAEYNG